MLKAWHAVRDVLLGDKWFMTFAVTVMGILSIGAFIISDAHHDRQVGNILRQHDLIVDKYKEASNKVNELYFESRVTSAMRGHIMQEQKRLIQELIKRLEDPEDLPPLDPKRIL